MILKTGQDRPVRPLTAHGSGPIRPIRSEWYWTGVGPLELEVQPINQTNQPGWLKLIFPPIVVVLRRQHPRAEKKKAFPFCSSEPAPALETPSFHDPVWTPAPTPTPARKGSIFCPLEHPHTTPKNPHPHPAPEKPTPFPPNPPPHVAAGGGKALLLPVTPTGTSTRKSSPFAQPSHPFF